jgi:hypothetical protein
MNERRRLQVLTVLTGIVLCWVLLSENSPFRSSGDMKVNARSMGKPNYVRPVNAKASEPAEPMPVSTEKTPKTRHQTNAVHNYIPEG